MQNFSEKPQKNIFQTKWTRRKRAIWKATLKFVRVPELVIGARRLENKIKKWNPRWVFSYKYGN